MKEVALILFCLAISLNLLSAFQRFICPVSSTRTAFNLLFTQHTELSSNVETLRSELLSLCDEYQSQEKYFAKTKSPRKIRELPVLLEIERKIELKILQLSIESPIKNALQSWGNSASPIDGSWKLRFTTALDAKPELFNKQKDREISVFQYVNSTIGTITNIIQSTYKSTHSPISTIRVTVKGNALNDNRLQLSFQTVNIERPDARLFKRFSFPFPQLPFLNLIGRKKDIGPYFDLYYLDDDLRIHKTDRGDFFVQTRVYDVWDPMVGWKRICLL